MLARSNLNNVRLLFENFLCHNRQYNGKHLLVNYRSRLLFLQHHCHQSRYNGKLLVNYQLLLLFLRHHCHQPRYNGKHPVICRLHHLLLLLHLNQYNEKNCWPTVSAQLRSHFHGKFQLRTNRIVPDIQLVFESSKELPHSLLHCSLCFDRLSLPSVLRRTIKVEPDSSRCFDWLLHFA